MHIKASLYPVKGYKDIHLYEGSELIGHCLLDERDAFYVRLYSVEIKEYYRGMGFGTYMIEKTIQVARLMGYKTMWLYVRKNNTAAVKLYQRMGFVEVACAPSTGCMEMELKL